MDMKLPGCFLHLATAIPLRHECCLRLVRAGSAPLVWLLRLELIRPYPEFWPYRFVVGKHRANGTLIFIQDFYGNAIAFQVAGQQVYLSEAVGLQ